MATRGVFLASVLLLCLGVTWAGPVSNDTPKGGTCQWQGREYSISSQVPSPGADPCVTCHCTEGSPEPQVACAATMCDTLRCVDSVTQPGQCCATCPNGPNCYHAGRVIAWGSVESLRVGEYCHALCQCSEAGGRYSTCDYDCQFPDEDGNDQGQDAQ